MTNWTSAELAVMANAGYVPSEELPIELQRALYLEPLFGDNAGEVLLLVLTFKESIRRHSGSFTRMLRSSLTDEEEDLFTDFGLESALPQNAAGITVPRTLLEEFLHEEMKAYLPATGDTPIALDTLTDILFVVANQSSPIADEATEAAARVHHRMLNH